MIDKKDNSSYWKIAFNILGICWLIGTILKMRGIDGGFWTGYMNDIVFPAWLYIYFRGLLDPERNIPRLILVGNWFGLSPERAATSIFASGSIFELKSLIWPSNAIGGTYDIFDFVAYGSGLLICYLIDKNNS